MRKGLLTRLLPARMRLDRDLRKLDRLFGPLVEKAKGDEREQLISEHLYERSLVVGELDAMETAYWRRMAGRYHVPSPGRRFAAVTSIKRTRTSTTTIIQGPGPLSEVGIFKMKKLVQEEQKKRREA